ncbi:penicillin-binding protein 1A [Pannus brasiliensis CCIBt3594]|uniref:Penicillin-binding protein 1A n=1 Tax=Pannus brasiliensis CCIBt3594 TaxID=1427578 RepID=A0AAW9QTT6_9CHRO
MKFKEKLEQIFQSQGKPVDPSPEPQYQPLATDADANPADPAPSGDGPQYKPLTTEEGTPIEKTKLPAAVNRLKTDISGLIAKTPLPEWRKHPKFWIFVGMGLGISGGAIAIGWQANRFESSLPDNLGEVLTYARKDTLTIEAADGTVLKQNGPVSHDTVKLAKVPEVVREAFIASEDRRFSEHGGVDAQGIFRALFSNLRAGGVKEGGSTITQQLARIVFLSQERSVDRKLREMRIAQKIEDKYSKDQILERYLNLVYLGSGAYGIADASQVYFSKPIEKLTLPEAATLAGIVPAPSLYSPLENPKAAKERRDTVLKLMAAEKLITPAEAEKAIASPLATKPSPLKRLQREAPYFTDYVEKELPKLVPAKALQEGGIVVKTTLNPGWQKEAEKVIERGVSRYGRWQGFQQAALVSIDPKTGQIKAMVGGKDYDKNQFNRVTQAKRQPGSTFKPFVYAAAIAAGRSPYSSYKDVEYTVDGYKPENFGDRYSGRELTMRDALTSSVNVVAVQVLVGVGWNPVIKLANAMGIESKLLPTYSLALGASEVTLLELTGAYGTFANNGVHRPVYGIDRVIDRHGKVLYEAKFKPTTALNKNTAATMTWMLQNVVNSGTGTPAQIGRPVAGKTGTSDKARDLWFVGYIPQLVTGVWLGNDNNKPTNGASTMSAWMWRQFMLKATENMPREGFADPNLNSRPKTLTAEPLKPRRVSFTLTSRSLDRSNRSNPSASIDDGSQGDRPTRRRRRFRVRREEPTVQAYRGETRSETRSEDRATRRSERRRRRSTIARSNSAPAASTPRNSAPAAAPVTVPVTVSEPDTRSVPIQITPPPDVAPVAPPAERR